MKSGQPDIMDAKNDCKPLFDQAVLRAAILKRVDQVQGQIDFRRTH